MSPATAVSPLGVTSPCPPPPRPQAARRLLRRPLTLGLPLTACGGASTADPHAKEVTVYSADGLKSEQGDGFSDTVFKDFEKKTGIKVNYVESGSGAAVQRLARERANTEADVLVTLPPFIQQAEGKGLLDTYRPKGADQVAAALAKIMKNVDIFHPDWNDLDKNLDSYVEAWREATGG